MAKKEEAKQQELVVDIVLQGGKIPQYKTEGALGADMYAVLRDDINLPPGFRAMIPLGFSTAIPEGWGGLVLPRSGLAAEKGLTVLNSPGLIDVDYRGEWQAIVINHNSNPVTISSGDRIAQVVFVPIAKAAFNLVEKLPETERGNGGMGSTGK